MKKFELKSSYYIDENQVVYVTLKPIDVLIEDYLASNHELINKSDIQVQIDELINQMTPILFEKFQDLECVNNDIKSQFVL